MGFKLKTLFFMISMLAVVSLIYTCEAIRTEKEIIRKEIIHRAEAVTILATKVGELPIFSGNLELMRSAISFLRANVEVSTVAFYDSQGKPLVHDGPADSPLAPIPVNHFNVPIYMSEEEQAFVFVAPVVMLREAEPVDYILGGESAREVKEKIGWVRLGFSKAVMRQNEREIVTRGVVLATMFLSVGSILAYLLVSVALRPLERMVQRAGEVAHGDLTREVEVEREDEIGSLARAFDTMRLAISQVLDETNGLIVAVRAGRLESRGNAEAFQGGWRQLVTGINQLTDAFAAANEELKVSKEAAETASRAKSDFISSMSHELRTPLNAILGYTQLLKRQENLTDPQRQQLEIMQSSGEHLLTLINDILDLGRIEADRMEVEEMQFDLPALLRQVYHLAKPSADDKGLSLELRVESPLPAYVQGDERKLRQVLLNLLANAVKYTGSGGITLRVRYGDAGDSVLHCEVTDTGIGIPPEKQQAIFEPFTQLQRDRQLRAGTGLGLSISKRLLLVMGGEIGVESACGRGSTFWFELALPSIAASEAAHTGGEPHGERETTAPEPAQEKRGNGSRQKDDLVPPPREELEQLYDLALRGDLQKIEARAAALEEMDESYLCFARTVRELSASCKAKAVLALLEQYRGRPYER